MGGDSELIEKKKKEDAIMILYKKYTMHYSYW